MSKLFSPLFLAALMLPAAALAQAAPAAPSGTKVGIINMQTAIVATNEGQRDFEALAKKFEPKRTELKGISDDLDSMKKQLDTQGSKLNEETRSDLVKKIEAKQKTLTRASEDAQSELQAQQNEIAQKIVQKMGPVIGKYAKDNSLGMILDATRAWPDGELIWANDTVDLTKAIVDAYNAQSDVPPPAKPAAAAPKPAAAAPKPAVTTPKPAAPKPN
jgi:Skp family chaperone for outer membrane proteins